MEGQKNPAKPIDQENEEFIEDQPNRRDQKEHSSDPAGRPRDIAHDRESSGSTDEADTDDIEEDSDEMDRDED